MSEGLEFKKNAKEDTMKTILDNAGVDYSHVYAKEEVVAEEPELEVGPTSPKKGREADNVAELKGEKDGLFFLGNCVKTGEPLYKKLSK
jgi:hypothetical protein